MNIDIQASKKRLKQDIQTLSTMIDNSSPGYTRRPFTRWYLESRQWLSDEMNSCGLEVTVDAASNLLGRCEGKNPALKPIMIGSHTDSVVGGGRFDGIVGVIAGIEIVRQLNKYNIQLNHPLLIVDFTAEEASEYGISTIGSRGMVGELSEKVLDRTDKNGLMLRNGLEMMGGRPKDIAREALKPGDLSLYLEMHIEQGPFLEKTSHELGVVSGIVGIQRHKIIVDGQSNHAGTTPMNLRYDALTAASQLILSIEDIANKTYETQVVGTVGRLFVEPNGSNVIPGRVTFDFEWRSLDKTLLDHMSNQLNEKIRDIEYKRKLAISMECLSNSDSAMVSAPVLKVLKESCNKVGSVTELPSGAGHDANQLAKVAPIGMIFVPSKDGKSHCQEEQTDEIHIAKGVQALINAIMSFDLDNNKMCSETKNY